MVNAESNKCNKIPMQKEEREYFENGVRTLCGTEVIYVKNLISTPEAKQIFTFEDLEFMKKELARQAGAIFARVLRAIKRKDFEEAQRVMTGK